MTTVRAARREDAAAILRLVHELAVFEKLAGPAPEAEARLVEDLFGASPRAQTLVAEDDGVVVAYAVSFEAYSTFLARPVLYVEDVYVTPAARRRGVATRLMRALAREAVARGCARMAWVTLDWNDPAMETWARLGAKPTPWVSFALDGESLARLASLV